MNTPKQEVLEHLVSRAVESVYPSKEALVERLSSGQPMTWYLGIDPTGPTLHIGHAIVLKKLGELQALGHKVILLIGDFTARIGDPTDKSAARVRLTAEQVLKNAAIYKEQAAWYLAFDGEHAAEVRYNSEWLEQLSFADVVELSSHFTVQRMLERDMFERRIKAEKPVYLHEFLYPLMQAYDSVALDVDGEVGGNDQTFNMLAGRTLLRDMKQKEKFVITMKLLADPSGVKMGKSEGNMITLQDSAKDMYGKVMSWTDGMIVPALELISTYSPEEIQTFERHLAEGVNPRDIKDRLAQNVVQFFYGEKEAIEVADAFRAQFHAKELPRDIEDRWLDAMPLVDMLVEVGFAPSKSEARRLIEGGGIRCDGEVLQHAQELVHPTETGRILQKGKRHFVRIRSAQS